MIRDFLLSSSALAQSGGILARPATMLRARVAKTQRKAISLVFF